jgi:hypothetical protein
MALRKATTIAGIALAVVVLLPIGALGSLAGATAIRAEGRSTTDTVVGVLRSVTAHRIIVESSAGGGAHGYRIDVLTTVCYEPNLCMESGNTSPLLPGATVRAQVATNRRGDAHASTIFVTSVAATIRVESIDREVITGRSTRADVPFTVVRRPFTILVDAARGEVRGVAPDVQVGDVLYFTGLAGIVDGSPVTIAARLFP